MQILTKDFVDTYSLSTIGEDRFGMRNVKINGREYYKTGYFQAVTVVGNVFDVYDLSVKQNKRVLFVGVSRQHPCDYEVSKQAAYEAANLRAWSDPTMVIEIGPNFNKNAFVAIARAYLNTLKLEFVKTREELEIAKKEKEVEPYVAPTVTCEWVSDNTCGSGVEICENAYVDCGMDPITSRIDDIEKTLAELKEKLSK